MSAEASEAPPSEFYANLTQVALTGSDLAIVFGLSSPAPIGTSQSPPHRTVSVVRMSPMAAKILAVSLTKMLEVYEQRFFPILLSAELVSDIDQSFEISPSDAVRYGVARGLILECAHVTDGWAVSVVRPEAITSFGSGRTVEDAQADLVSTMRAEAKLLRERAEQLTPSLHNELLALERVTTPGDAPFMYQTRLTQGSAYIVSGPIVGDSLRTRNTR
jgi:hypothetical protein